MARLCGRQSRRYSCGGFRRVSAGSSRVSGRVSPHSANRHRPQQKSAAVHAALRGIPCQVIIVGRLDPAVIETLQENSVHYENFVSTDNGKIVAPIPHCGYRLFPSTYEGFGMPIVEAQRVGRPVVTSSVSSMPRLQVRGRNWWIRSLLIHSSGNPQGDSGP